MSIRDHIIQWAREREPVSINEIAKHVQILFEKQAAAANKGMDAAKAHASHMEAEAKRLHAESNPEALESERQANAELTEELEALRSERAALLEQVVYWRECVQEMAARVAELESYNLGLANESHELRAERDALGRMLHDKAVLLQRAEGERDELASELRSHKAAIEGLQGERDELTGRVAELKPCPFCAGQAVKGALEDGGHVIECMGCHASTAVHYDRCENLVSAWNERTTSLARLKAQWQAEALDKALEKLVPRMLTKADQQIVRDTIRSIKTPGSRQAQEPTE